MSSAFESPEAQLQASLKALRLARLPGIAAGIFLLLWAFCNPWRWNSSHAAVLFESAFLGIYAVVLLLPWERIQHKNIWPKALGALIAGSIGFAILMVLDFLFQCRLAMQLDEKPAPAAFLGVLVLMSVLQAPVAIFLRKPALLH